MKMTLIQQDMQRKIHIQEPIMGKTIRNVPRYFSDNSEYSRDGKVKSEYNEYYDDWGRNSAHRLKKMSTQIRRRRENREIDLMEV